jgi:hypothetical protein
MKQPPLRLEPLEDRLAPAVFGYPWPDPSHLTVSFVPAGTLAGATLTQNVTDAERVGVLRALQTWEAAANVNFAVVPDSGLPLGAAGPAQGDPRFGDVRVALLPLSADVVSTSVPFSPGAGTWSGDMLFNSTCTFGPGGFDLYSVALHEVGHVLGVSGNTTNTGSVMFEYYSGPYTGLDAAATTAVQALYGARTDEGDDQGHDDNGQGKKNLEPLGTTATGVVLFGQDGTLHHADKTETYRLTLPQGSGPASLDVEVWSPAGTPGLSLTVLDAGGTVLGSQAGPDATGGVNLHLDGLTPGARLSLVVSGTAVTAYHLAAQVNAPRLVSTPSTTGTLTAGIPEAFRAVWVRQSGVVHFDVQAQMTAGEAVEATLFDLQGNVVYRQVLGAGQMLSVNLFLQPGGYTWRLVGGMAGGSALPATAFTIASMLLNDPVGPPLHDPTQIPPPDPPLWYEGGFVILLALQDPYGRPLSPIPPPTQVVLGL